MRAYTQGGWAHRLRVSSKNFDSKKLSFCVLLKGFELGSLMSLNLESDALPLEPPCHPYVLLSLSPVIWLLVRMCFFLFAVVRSDMYSGGSGEVKAAMRRRFSTGRRVCVWIIGCHYFLEMSKGLSVFLSVFYFLVCFCCCCCCFVSVLRQSLWLAGLKAIN